MNEPMSWRSAAACRDADPDLFFLDRGEKYSEAREFCDACPVAVECLEDGLFDDYGFRAGTIPRQRQQLRAELGLHRADHGTRSCVT